MKANSISSCWLLIRFGLPREVRLKKSKAGVLLWKWRVWNGMYKKIKVKHDIVRHSPETRAAVEKEDKCMEECIMDAVEDWWPFGTFHQFLGSMAKNYLALVEEPGERCYVHTFIQLDK